MSIDRSLKLSTVGAGVRSVLKRDERIAALKADGKYEEGTVFNLPKVKVTKFKKKK